MRILILLLAFFMTLTAGAQVDVRGRVTLQSDNEGAIGVTVQVKGETIGTMTDLDGMYAIKVPSGNSILVFSYIGYITQEIEVGNKNMIDVVMSENASQLDEVVVTGYGTQKRSSISGSVASISNEEFAEKPILRVEQALQGRAAGVQVAQVSGSPGSPLTVRIRGVGTINNSDPLYIVDGGTCRWPRFS
jgi:hypothetical protein